MARSLTTHDEEKRPTPVAVAARAPAAATGASVSRRWGPFAALARYPTYRRLWFGSLAASLGQWMQQVALGWLALTLTDSPFFVGVVGLSAGLPFLTVAIPAGVLIDRVDRRRLMLGCQALAAALALVVAADVLGGWVRPWHLPLAAFANGSLQAVLNPTQQSLVPRLVQREDLTQAVGLNSAGQNLTRVVGPSLAGALIGFSGEGAAFLSQAAALGVALALVAGIRVPPSEAARVAGPRGAFAGIRLIAERPDLRGLFLLACIPTFLVFPYIQFLSVFARDILRIGPGGLGLLMAASGSGAVVGSLAVAARRELAGAGRLVLALTVAYGGVIFAIAASRSVWLTVPLLVVAGVLGAAFMSANNALLQLRIGDEVRGRVMSAYMLTWGLMPLGAMPMGLLADRTSTPLAVATGAALSSLATLALGLRSPAVRDL